ncbi:MAG: PQQ-dependent dehydrogenase, methanol/ethanol family [Acidobacteria bacterium]|nr:PQQ-dependent dehydrogenase, methanol/ethanol family [Acidobacteriota bacterium]
MKYTMRLAAGLLFAATLTAQVTSERLLNAAQEPGNWLTYSGTYQSQRYSPLDQITRENASKLKLSWVFQASSLQKFEATPLVVDGVMYLTQAPNDVVALDAKTGRKFWTYNHQLPETINVCCGAVNRGLAILGDQLFMGTVDGYLLALDATTGAVNWKTKVVEYKNGYSLTVAPLIVKGKVIVGTAGGEYGIRGFLDAYDAQTGEQAWRFYTIPGPGEPGHETWEGDSWMTGGGSAWVTGSYDPELNLVYWGIGNPAPDWNGDVRMGDNLYTDSAVALDADTGKLKWHFQFTPHDEWDWDSVQVPVLVDREFQGRMRKVILWGNRNGHFYVLDRATGEYLLGKAFVHQTWNDGLDEKGRPKTRQAAAPSIEGTKVYPGVQGGTNWYSPSYSPQTGLFYLSVWEYASTYHKNDPIYAEGHRFLGSLPRRVEGDPGYGAIRALDPETGEMEWEFRMVEVTNSGLLSTSTGVLFSGSNEGHFLALDARNGQEIWRTNLGGRAYASPITYTVDGEQQISIAAGNALFTFVLGE